MSLFGRLVDPHNQHLAINTLSADGRVRTCKCRKLVLFLLEEAPESLFVACRLKPALVFRFFEVFLLWLSVLVPNCGTTTGLYKP